MRELATSAMELRFDLAGRAAVRVAGGPVAPRHVEPVPPRAPWVAQARCGTATGWLLAHETPPDPEAVQERLQHAVERETALRLQAAARAVGPLAADLLERLTHRLRTDVTTLQAVADGAIKGLFEPEDLAVLPGELERSARESLRRLSGVREVMGVLTPGARLDAEPVQETLRAELEGAGRGATIVGPPGEAPLTLIPGPGWAACARMLARDPRLEMFVLGPDPGGWLLTTGVDGIEVGWTERTAGELVHVGQIVAAAGGSAVVTEPFGIRLTLPAAPPSG
ncbi:hypothetical protein [Solirubrobacter soli]|uniref:hypothetical protein n=1 Tax=Solirubrobacter soli TaxID=363832 RepID=UPI0003FD3BDB|nr:hypothetical protein [Solirubrobacter soli]